MSKTKETAKVESKSVEMLEIDRELNVHTSASSYGYVVGKLEAGERVGVYQTKYVGLWKEKWVRISADDEPERWILAEY